MEPTPASRATAVHERDAQLLSIGQQCSEATCHLVDFLPFKCEHCRHSFCQEHFRVEAHRCPEYDESKHDRVAPNCPLCNSPVAIPPGQDPNVQMDAHLTNECSVMVGKAKAKSSPVCAKGNCTKILFSPIKCTHCRKKFCPSHRFPDDHECGSAPLQENTNKTAKSQLLDELNDKATTVTSAVKKTVSSASASVSKSIVNMKTSTPMIRVNSNSSGSGSPAKSPGNNPFSKVDRRAKAERESRLKALRARAQKGLLSEEEKLILATEEAALQNEKGCVIM